MHKWKHSIHLCPLTAMAQSDMPIRGILNERTPIASFLEKIGFCIYFLRLCHFFLLLSPFKSFTISVWLWLDALFIFASCSLLGEKSNNIPLHLFTFNATVIWKIGNFLFGEGKCVFFLHEVPSERSPFAMACHRTWCYFKKRDFAVHSQIPSKYAHYNSIFILQL